MAAATTLISAGVALAGTGFSVAQFAGSAQEKRKAESDANEAMNSYANIKEQDVFSGIQVPTMGSELQQQSADRSTAQALQMVSGTPEMAIGATPGLVQANMEQTRQIGSDLDAMKYQRDLDQARNKARIEQGRVGRQEDLYSAQLERANVDRQQAQINRQAGIQGMFKGAEDTLGYVDKLVSLYPSKKTNKAKVVNGNTYTPMTYNPAPIANVSPDYGIQVPGIQPSDFWGASGLGYQNQVIP
jgi:cell division septum initiation protein DivIVA